MATRRTSVTATNGQAKRMENGSPEEHAVYVWDHFITRSAAENVFFVAHSYGGLAFVELVLGTDSTALITFLSIITLKYLWMALKEINVPQYLIILISNLYYGQEPTVRREYGETEWLPIGKVVRRSPLSPLDIENYKSNTEITSFIAPASSSLDVAVDSSDPGPTAISDVAKISRPKKSPGQMIQREAEVKTKVTAVALTDSIHNVWHQEAGKTIREWMRENLGGITVNEIRHCMGSYKGNLPELWSIIRTKPMLAA
ncbi:hypothetical protein EYD10_03886 [Varanus komodoensis]|nr:hypothetical protein EYD10_03886 [Varanus komodoensis]